MKYKYNPNLEEWFLTPTLKTALSHVAKNHYSDVNQAIESMKKIDTKYYCDKNQMDKYGKILDSLCKECDIPPLYNERKIAKQEGTSIQEKITYERIAEELRISRPKLSQDIHNKRFIAEPKNKNYIKNRQAYLLLYSIFFEMSPWYILGLTPDKYDYEGPFDLMCMGNMDYFACYNLIAAAFTRLECKYHEVDTPDKIIEYFPLIEPMRDLAVFLNQNSKETNQQYCLSIWYLFKHIPWIEKNFKVPLPISAEDAQKEGEYFQIQKAYTKHTIKYLENFITDCEAIGKADLRLLIVYAMLVHCNKWEILKGIQLILKNGDFQS